MLTASEVAAEAEEATAFLNAAILGSRPRSTTITIERELPQTEQDTRQMVEKTENDLQSYLSLGEFSDLRNRLIRQDRILRDLRDQIREESARLDQFLEQIRTRRTVWNLTGEAGRISEYPETAMTVIQQTLADLEQGQEEIGERRSELLALQNSIVELRTLINDGTNHIVAAEEERLSRLFSFDGPRLWDVSQLDARETWTRFSEQMIRKFSSLTDYTKQNKHGIFLSVLILLILALLLSKTRKRLADHLEDQEHVIGAKQVLEHPFSSSILFVSFLNSVLRPNAPQAWYNAILLVALVALVRLVAGFVPSRLVSFSLVLLSLRALDLVNSQIPDGTPLGRLLTVSMILIAIGSLIRFRNRLKTMDGSSSKWSAALHLASWSGLLLLAIALLSGISGNFALAGLLGSGTVRTAFLALAFWLAFSVFRGILLLSLRSKVAMRSPLIRANRDLMYGKISRIVGTLTILIFLISVPYLFSVLDPVSSAVIEAVTTPLSLGALSFSPSDILAFIFLVWLSFQVSRLVCFILDEDFLPRFRLPRGMPAAISHLTQYVILLLGFLIALTAAGFDVGRLTILASAFGVGIGFGLQNVVNNFVSGLILLFERPVHVGDKIQLSQDVAGEVTRIGIRASVVKTVDGADILVPNGNLISNELTNWTLSDRRRRITIPVGVAYGTKPRKVLDILKQLVEGHSEVLRDPGPTVLFMGFGESSLDFSVRFWVDQFEKGFLVRSDLALAISDALEESGIEIPFPQRDIHLRSVPPGLRLQNGTQHQVTEQELDSAQPGPTDPGSRAE